MVKPISGLASGRRPAVAAPPSAPRTRGDSTATRLGATSSSAAISPGDRLPPERELATRLGTNRNTLREALRILESENLVRARQGDGTIVLDWRAVGEINLLPSFLSEKTPADDRFDAMVTLLNLRARLMEETLGRASLDATVEDMDAVEAALLTLARSGAGPAAVVARRRRVLSPGGAFVPQPGDHLGVQHLRQDLHGSRRALSRGLEQRRRLSGLTRPGRALDARTAPRARAR